MNCNDNANGDCDGVDGGNNGNGDGDSHGDGDGVPDSSVTGKSGCHHHCSIGRGSQGGEVVQRYSDN